MHLIKMETSIILELTTEIKFSRTSHKEIEIINEKIQQSRMPLNTLKFKEKENIPSFFRYRSSFVRPFPSRPRFARRF